jgi:hypothetical protein
MIDDLIDYGDVIIGCVRCLRAGVFSYLQTKTINNEENFLFFNGENYRNRDRFTFTLMEKIGGYQKTIS